MKWPPRLTIKRRKDGSWCVKGVIGCKWMGPYPTQKEALDAKKRMIRFYTDDTPYKFKGVPVKITNQEWFQEFQESP
jgi:hypothetical protein